MSGEPPQRGVRGRGEHVIALPRRAVEQVRPAPAGPAADAVSLLRAHHAAALSCAELGDHRAARWHVRTGLSLASQACSPAGEARLRLVLAWIDTEAGCPERARAELRRAEPALEGGDAGRAACVRGLLWSREGRHRRAAEAFSAALALLGQEDRRWVARALSQRGVELLHIGRSREAEADFSAAERLFAADGQPGNAAVCRHRRGCAAYRAGELPRALRLFDEAVDAGLDAESAPEFHVDRARAQAAAGLRADAHRSVAEVVDRLARSACGTRLARTRLKLAELAFLDGDAACAEREALRARRLFRSERQHAWARLAAAVAWDARLRTGRCSWGAIVLAQRAARACARAGWERAAARVRLSAGRAALRSGWCGRARVLLGQAGVLRALREVPARERAQGWLALALVAELDGDVRAVLRACRAGLREVERHLAGIAALEMRVHEWSAGAELADVAMRAALSTGDPCAMLRWTERLRVGALPRQCASAALDRGLGEALERLRAASSAVERAGGRRAVVAGRPTPAIAELEQRVQHRAVRTSGRTRPWPEVPGLADVGSHLGRTVLLALFEHGDTLFAVSGVDGRFSAHVLGPRAEVEKLVGRLRHALARRAYGASAAVDAAHAAQARHCAQRLHELLLGPVEAELGGERPLLVMPSGSLHVLPWAALPGCRGRRVTVTPSLRCWLRGADREAPAARTGGSGQPEQVWIAGPGLEHAEDEVRALHAAGGGRLLTGERATAEAALRELDGAGVAHIAAHGTFREDRPMLSQLRLADGPLYAYDLERLSRGPRTAVLAACEVGGAAVGPGEQVSGVTATLLGKGTRTVVASVLPVPDGRAARVMASLHEGMRRGLAAESALAEAQQRWREPGFVCFGHGG
ncbi:CHAT domain-containing protein [Salinifilum ghardaiensis]